MRVACVNLVTAASHGSGTLADAQKAAAAVMIRRADRARSNPESNPEFRIRIQNPEFRIPDSNPEFRIQCQPHACILVTMQSFHPLRLTSDPCPRRLPRYHDNYLLTFVITLYATDADNFFDDAQIPACSHPRIHHLFVEWTVQPC